MSFVVDFSGDTSVFQFVLTDSTLFINDLTDQDSLLFVKGDFDAATFNLCSAAAKPLRKILPKR